LKLAENTRETRYNPEPKNFRGLTRKEHERGEPKERVWGKTS